MKALAIQKLDDLQERAREKRFKQLMREGERLGAKHGTAWHYAMIKLLCTHDNWRKIDSDYREARILFAYAVMLFEEGQLPDWNELRSLWGEAHGHISRNTISDTRTSLHYYIVEQVVDLYNTLGHLLSAHPSWVAPEKVRDV
jgi:hypothetical protein